MKMVPLTRVKTYGEMRGAENYNIKKYKTLDTSQRGVHLAKSPANRALSIADNRTGERGRALKAFEAQAKMRDLARRADQQRTRVPRTPNVCD